MSHLLHTGEIVFYAKTLTDYMPGWPIQQELL